MASSGSIFTWIVSLSLLLLSLATLAVLNLEDKDSFTPSKPPKVLPKSQAMQTLTQMEESDFSHALVTVRLESLIQSLSRAYPLFSQSADTPFELQTIEFFYRLELIEALGADYEQWASRYEGGFPADVGRQVLTELGVNREAAWGVAQAVVNRRYAEALGSKLWASLRVMAEVEGVVVGMTRLEEAMTNA